MRHIAASLSGANRLSLLSHRLYIALIGAVVGMFPSAVVQAEATTALPLTDIPYINIATGTIDDFIVLVTAVGIFMAGVGIAARRLARRQQTGRMVCRSCGRFVDQER